MVCPVQKTTLIFLFTFAYSCLLSEILYIILLQPAAGTPVPGKDVVICKYHSDPTVALGYLSFAFLLVSTVAGLLSLFYPYKGKSVPQSALFKSGSFIVFFNIAL